MSKTKIGIIGCGNISDIYLRNCTKTFRNLEVAAVSDLIPERARKAADQYSVEKILTSEELISDPEIEIVLNLTTPHMHTKLNLAALKAGKHIYTEKPLAVTREDGQRLLKAAKDRGLLAGSAPDTFLGSGLQTCRKLIDDGWIGEPVAATAFMTCRGHESWHPDPGFYYQAGGGPMFDMGPYYLTALIALLGPVKRVTGSARKTFDHRTITSEPKYGTVIDVEVPTHVAGILDFESGAVATIITSFDVWHAQLPRIEVYGSEGTLSVPDPNTFGGPVLIRRHNAPEWTQMPLTHGFEENSRGIGLADMALALKTNRPHRANAEMAYHVLDIMHAIHDASNRGRHIELDSSCTRPEPLPKDIWV